MITPGSGEIAGQLRRTTPQVRSNEGRTGSGSGVVRNRQGQIVSNAQVIHAENVGVEFWDGDGRKGDNVLAAGNPPGFASRPALGLRIQQIVPGSKAHVASPLPGVVIIGADDTLFSSPDDPFDRQNKGGLMQLKYHRSGKAVPREVAIPLGPIADGRLSAAA